MLLENIELILSIIVSAGTIIGYLVISNKFGISFKRKRSKYPFFYQENFSHVRISSKGKCKATFIYKIINNDEFASHELYSSIDNSNNFPYKNLKIQAFIDDCDYSENLEEIVSKEREILYKLRVPEDYKKNPKINIKYVINYGKFYPSKIEELNEIIRKNNNQQNNHFIAKGSAVGVYTEFLRLQIDFEPGYPVCNITPCVTFSNSSEERRTQKLNDVDFHIAEKECIKVVLSKKLPLQGCSYNLRWNLKD